MNDDRRVHAVKRGDFGGSHYEIVRYDRAGKWRIELGDHSRSLSLDTAVRTAVDGGYEIHYGLPGGRSFDSRCRARELRNAQKGR